MHGILRIAKLLLVFIVLIAGWFYADQVSTNMSLTHTQRTVLLTVGAVPGLLLYALLNVRGSREMLKLLVGRAPASVWIWRLVGVAILFFGIFLVIGNRSGNFRSAPFAGSVVVVIGVIVLALKGAWRSEDHLGDSGSRPSL